MRATTCKTHQPTAQPFYTNVTGFDLDEPAFNRDLEKSVQTHIAAPSRHSQGQLLLQLQCTWQVSVNTFALNEVYSQNWLLKNYTFYEKLITAYNWYCWSVYTPTSKPLKKVKWRIPMHLDWVILTRLVQNHAEYPGQLPSAEIIHSLYWQCLATKSACKTNIILYQCRLRC